MSTPERQDEEIESSLGLPEPGFQDPLEDLYTDAMLTRKMRVARKVADPSMRNALDATAKKMKELYTLPENWERSRGVALIDKDSRTLIGNFSEYLHRTIAGTRKLLREHQPIAIDATEEVSGYLGEELTNRMRGHSTWTEERHAILDLLLPELMVGSPEAPVKIGLYLGTVVRVDLQQETQFASMSGATVLILPAGTNVLEQLGPDGRNAVRKAAGLQ
jgi:hypothetical protein